MTLGIMQKAVETYDFLEAQNKVGQYDERHAVLAPIGHVITFVEMEITLKKDGSFVEARLVNKDEGKVIIPVTEKSAGRTNGPVAHPLCDELRYLANFDDKRHQLYMEQLQGWAAFDPTQPKVNAILKYIQSNHIINDLHQAQIIEVTADGKAPDKKDEKLKVRWRVLDTGRQRFIRSMDKVLFIASGRRRQ